MALLLLPVLLVAGAYAWAGRHGEIAPVARPAPATFDRKLVEQGRKLAGVGSCQVCHTKPGSKPYAGGLPLPTPFGTIFSTNITPDVETGIGAWSEQAFVRAMREGVDRQGRHLYPAFPYDYFTKTTDDDLKAIYAYLMTREAVPQTASANTLAFPYNLRPLLAGWKYLYLEPGAFRPDPARNGELNRGAYLVEGLGHCGACHTPRDQNGAAPKTGPLAYTGGNAEGWHVPPLTKDGPGLIPWTQKALVNYLIDGWDGQHGIAAGPMTPVVNELRDQSEDDVFAMAAYLMTLKGGEPPAAEQDVAAGEANAFALKTEWGHPENPPLPNDPVIRRGARVFESQCTDCHKAGGKPVPLALTAVVNAPDATNLVRVTYQGIKPPRGVLDRSMPARATQISDEDMVALAAFVRSRFSRKPAWTGVGEIVRRVRSDLH